MYKITACFNDLEYASHYYRTIRILLSVIILNNFDLLYFCFIFTLYLWLKIAK